MSKLLSRLSVVAWVALIASPASAQAVNWAGFYLGGTAGYAAGHSNANASVTCPPNGYFCAPAANQANVAPIVANGSGSLSPNGFTGGVFAGYNWQRGAFLYGVEADVNAGNWSSSRSSNPTAYVTNAAVQYTIGSAIESRGFFTARGRVGWTSSNWLLYATGGVAVAELSASNNMRDTATLLGNSTNVANKAGYAAGGGIEWALGRNWIVRAEYLHIGLGRVATTATVGTAANNNMLTTSTSVAAEIARGGIAYKF